jgi:hypothetical protein
MRIFVRWSRWTSAGIAWAGLGVWVRQICKSEVTANSLDDHKYAGGVTNSRKKLSASNGCSIADLVDDDRIDVVTSQGLPLDWEN